MSRSTHGRRSRRRRAFAATTTDPILGAGAALAASDPPSDGGADADAGQGGQEHRGRATLEVALAVCSSDEDDAHVLRILTPTTVSALSDRARNPGGTAAAAGAADAQRIAEQSMVLLKNDDDALPLDAAGLDRVAVIGSEADTIVAGGGSSLVGRRRISSSRPAGRR